MLMLASLIATMPLFLTTVPAEAARRLSLRADSGRFRIHPFNDNRVCITVWSDGQCREGDSLRVAWCVGDNHPDTAKEVWQYSITQQGSARLSATEDSSLCIDGGYVSSDRSDFAGKLARCNAGGIQLWQLIGLEGDTHWEHFSGNLRLRLEGDRNKCLDVKWGDQPADSAPYGMYQWIQMWECVEGNTNQLFTLEQA